MVTNFHIMRLASRHLQSSKECLRNALLTTSWCRSWIQKQYLYPIFVVQLCNDLDWNAEELPFTVIIDVCQPKTARTVSKADERVLEEPLKEYQECLHSGTITLLGTIHAFTDQLLKDLIRNAPIVYMVEDVLQSLPVLSTRQARFILGILQDIFGDIESDEGW